MVKSYSWKNLVVGFVILAVTLFIVQTYLSSSGQRVPETETRAVGSLQISQISSAHPRIFVTPATLAALRGKAQGSFLPDYQKLQGQTDGIAQAFQYLISGNETNAKNALSAAKSMMNNINASKSGGPDNERRISRNIYELGLIYDWIYNSPSVSASDKVTLRAGIMSGVEWEDCRDTNGTQHPKCFSEGAWPYHQYVTDPGFDDSHDTEIDGQILPALLAIIHDFTPAEAALAGRAEGYTQTMLDHIDSGWLPMLKKTMADDGGWWMGLMYNGTNLAPQYASFAALATAADQNLFAHNPFLARHIFFMLYTLLDQERGVIMAEEDMGFPYFRGNHYRLATMIGHFYQNGYAKWLADRIEGPWKSTYDSINEQYAENLIYKILWREPSLSAIPPDGLPLNAAFSGMGYFISRNGWSPQDAVILFKSMPYYQISHNHRSNAHFTIYKRGWLAVNSGRYQGSDDHDENYFRYAVAHNSLLIGSKSDGNPFEPINNPFGVDPFETNYSTNVYEGTRDYVYFKSDITNAYKAGTFPLKNRPARSDICIHCQRSMVYLRNVAGWPEPILVVADDLLGTATYDKAWLLHTQNQPAVAGNLITATEGEGKLFTRVLLSTDTDIRTVGGVGKEFTSWNGVNHPITTNPWRCKDCKWGNWRVELSPKTLHAKDNFLNILAPVDIQTGNPPDITDISNSTVLGTVVNNRVVVFPRDSSADLRSASYTIGSTSNANLTHLVVQVMPSGKYTVNGQTVTASKNGVLTFTMPHTANATYTLSYTGSTGTAIDNSYYYPNALFGNIPSQSSTPTTTPRATSSPTRTPTSLPGDINGDSLVNALDYVLLFQSFGKLPGQTGFDPRADITGDGLVNALDYVILFENFGKTR